MCSRSTGIQNTITVLCSRAEISHQSCLAHRHGNNGTTQGHRSVGGHSSPAADYPAGLTSSFGFGRGGNPIARPPNVNGRGDGSRECTSGGVDFPRLEVGNCLVGVSAAGRLAEWSYDRAGVERLV